MPKLGEVRIINPDIEFFNVDDQLKIINHMSPVYPIVPYKPKRFLERAKVEIKKRPSESWAF